MNRSKYSKSIDFVFKGIFTDTEFKIHSTTYIPAANRVPLVSTSEQSAVVLSLSLYTQSLHYLRQVDEVHELYSPVSTVMVCNGEGVVLVGGWCAYVCDND